MRVLHVVGARPNFMKTAPLVEQWKEHPEVEVCLVHTGQHYDERMSELFFGELGLPRPDVNLEVGSGTHAEVTGEVMRRLEPVLEEFRPDLVVVPGDVNSTLAGALTATKLGFPVAHIEAGLRSFDRSMPEEINRIVTDAISQYMLVSEPSGVDNLRDEGIAEERIFFVGNLMIDSLMAHRQKAEGSTVMADLGLEAQNYTLVTLHRPSNVDQRGPLEEILGALNELAGHHPVVWPIHPRSRARVEEFGLTDQLSALRVTEPLGYLDFLHLMDRAEVVLTDSGGIQEETTVLGVPCVTLRANTERPITLTDGTNVLCPSRRGRILAEHARAPARRPDEPQLPELWDGQAGARAAEVLLEHASPEA